MEFRYEIIVVGGGHAGCEAAYAAAKMGARTLLITMDMTKLAQMSCNPAMGGIAKGQIIREIDALGGMSGLITDRAMVQFRMLNRSKGPAMWSPRAQCDRMRFSIEWRKALESTENLFIWQEQATGLIIENDRVRGVETEFGTRFKADAVILTNGTFLNGLMHVGFRNITGGRAGDSASWGLSEQLAGLGFKVERMKTGTSARIDGRTINFNVLTEQAGDDEGRSFSFINTNWRIKEKRNCFITYTNEEVHQELRKGLEFSPLFQGKIKGRGPRYCPSIEDKIVTFKDKNAHQLFIEPEGLDTIEYYVNGFASSLPLEAQLKALRKVPGLESVEIFRPGYAIEYDFFQPTQIKPTLETKKIEKLYFAGQINGTTGYEEAAAQGIMAGINASLSLAGKEPLVLRRDEAYIGVLIDDLVTKGTNEPYRMFTSRAEYRLLLREESADTRLGKYGHALGLINDAEFARIEKKDEQIRYGAQLLEDTKFTPNKEFNAILEAMDEQALKDVSTAQQLVARKSFDVEKMLKIVPEIAQFDDYIREEILVEGKYARYIDKQSEEIERMKKYLKISIPEGFDFTKVSGLSKEVQEKLASFSPPTLQAAMNISGITPAAIEILHIYIKIALRGKKS